MGAFHAATQSYRASGTAGILECCMCQTPLQQHSSKPLETACPVQNTHGAGVVMPAHEHIVAAGKTPCVLMPMCWLVIALITCFHAWLPYVQRKFWGKSWKSFTAALRHGRRIIARVHFFCCGNMRDAAMDTASVRTTTPRAIETGMSQKLLMSIFTPTNARITARPRLR